MDYRSSHSISRIEEYSICRMRKFFFPSKSKKKSIHVHDEQTNAELEIKNRSNHRCCLDRIWRSVIPFFVQVVVVMAFFYLGYLPTVVTGLT